MTAGTATAPPVRAALLDLDGTLVDTVPDLAVCVDRMLVELDRPPAGEERTRLWVGNGIERLVHRALTGRLDGVAPRDLAGPALARFRELYREENGRRSRVYPGVWAGLADLAEAGVALACVTNKPAGFAAALLRATGLLEALAALVAAGPDRPPKPDPAPMLEAARALGVAPDHALVVGDSVNDVEAARAAGMRVACVRYGYNHGRDVGEAGPDAVLDSLADLRPWMQGGGGACAPRAE